MELTALNLLGCREKHLYQRCERLSFCYLFDVLFYLLFFAFIKKKF